MSCFQNCCGEVYSTPFGDLKGDTLQDATELQIIFSELISDGSTTYPKGHADYPGAVDGPRAVSEFVKNYDKARAIWANPVQYLNQQREGFGGYNPWKDLVSKIASDQMLGKYGRDGVGNITARVAFQKAHDQGDDRQTAAKHDGNESNGSDFSASFYGPMFDSDDEEEVRYPEHRYYLVKETHRMQPDNKTMTEQERKDHHFAQKYPVIAEEDPEADEEVAQRIRYFLLTQTNKRKQTVLHLAARTGDRHFVTMLVNEADYLLKMVPMAPGGCCSSGQKYQTIKDIVNAADRDKMTPLYILCEGNAAEEEEDSEEEDAELRELEKEILEQEQEQNRLLALEAELGEHDSDNQAEGGYFMGGSDTDSDDEEKNYNKKKEREHRKELMQRDEVAEGARYSPWIPIPELKDGKARNSECSRPSRRLLVQLLLEFDADPNYVSPIVNHTPLHWLAYYGDHRAIDVYIKSNTIDGMKKHPRFGLCNSKKDEQELADKHGALNLFIATNGLTPVDIAGDNGKMESLSNMVSYHMNDDNKRKIKAKFLPPDLGNKYSQDRLNPKQSERYLKAHPRYPARDPVTNKLVPPPTMESVSIIYVDEKNMTNAQKAYLRVAHWAIRLADFVFEERNEKNAKKKKQYRKMAREVLFFFVMDMGVSPFVKTYHDRSLVHALVKANLVDLLAELLCHEFNLLYSGEYSQFKDSATLCEDIKGDNVFHCIFKHQPEDRNEFLKVVFKPEYHVKMRQQHGGGGRGVQPDGGISDDMAIGGYESRNKLSFLPVDYEHDEDIHYPEDVVQANQDVFRTYLLSLEADYLVKTTGSKLGLKYEVFKKQLDDLKMEQGKEYWVLFVKREDSVIDTATNLFKNREESEKTRAHMNEDMDIYFAIKFNTKRLDRLAEKHMVYGDLDITNIRVPYDRIMRKEYSKFDSRQRYICIMKELESEIDFDRYMNTGIIDDHYPLHRTKKTMAINKSVSEHFWKLMATITFTEWINIEGLSWFDYAQPLHMMKKYFGEKYAFFYSFYVSYTAYLFFPAALGVALTAYELTHGAFLKSSERAQTDDPRPLDNPFNTAIGIFIACWSTIFVENWRIKQNKLIFEWDMDTPQDVLMNDNRREFKYMSYYCREVDQPQKKRIKNYVCKCIPVPVLDIALSVTMLGATATVMFFFEELTADDFESVDTESVLAAGYEDNFTFWPLVYAALLKVLEKINDFGVDKVVSAYNYQWIKDHENAIAYRLFFFKCLNSYFPLMFVAFYKQTYYTLFIMLVFELIINALIEIFKRSVMLACCVRYPRSQVSRAVDHIIDQDKELYRRQIIEREVEVRGTATIAKEEENDEERKKRLQTGVLRRQVVMNSVLDVDADGACGYFFFSYEKDTDIDGQLMDLVMQFGYVSFFSTVFPVAPFVSFVANLINLNTIAAEIECKKRGIPGVSVGIGNYLDMLDFISQATVAINVAIAYFTSQDTREYFKGVTGLGDLNFFILLVLVEHFLYGLKLVVQQMLLEGPEVYEHAQRINHTLEARFEKKKAKAHKNDFTTQQGAAARAFGVWVKKAEDAIDKRNAEIESRKAKMDSWAKQLEKKERLNKRHTGLPALSAKRKLIQENLDVKLWVYPDGKKEPERDKDQVNVHKFNENFEYLAQD